MTNIITRQDIENELQCTLPTGQTDSMITNICTWAESMFKLKTNRSSFSGMAADVAKYGMVLLAIDRLTMINRDLVTSAISSISEAGRSISFENGRTIESYRKEANMLIEDLKLPGTPNFDIIQADLQNNHTGIENSILYGE